MPASASFPLVPDLPAAAPELAPPGGAERSARDVTQGFLGFGLLRPFRRDLKADFAADGGERLVRSAVGQILCTMASSDFTQGEVPWRTDYPERATMRRTMASALGDVSSAGGIMTAGGGER